MEQPKIVMGVKSTTVALIALLALGAGIGIGIGIHTRISPCAEMPVLKIERDTTYLTDTVRGEVPKPIVRTIEKWDTVRMEYSPDKKRYVPSDTVTPTDPQKSDTTKQNGQIEEIILPRTSKVYKTEDYRAVVSGFRPALDSMEVYRKTIMTKETVTKLQQPRWSLTGGVGAGYSTDGRVVPHIGFTVGWVLWSAR